MPMVERILTHRQIDEVNTRIGQPAGNLDDFSFVFSVPQGQGIRLPIPTEDTVVSAPGGEIDEPVKEYRLPKMAATNLSGGLKKTSKIALVSQPKKKANLPPGEIFTASGF
jgi:hypothetical protein